MATSVLTAVQELGVPLSGPLADLAGPSAAIAMYGVAGTIAALPLMRTWRRRVAITGR
ncbi:hypothetical protein [Nonomuraea sp. NPDC004354]